MEATTSLSPVAHRLFKFLQPLDIRIERFFRLLFFFLTVLSRIDGFE
jgi:hypothetical protein